MAQDPRIPNVSRIGRSRQVGGNSEPTTHGNFAPSDANSPESSTQAPRRDVVFVSYARQDKRFLKHLMPHLELLEREGQVQVFTDQRIPVGGHWREDIDHALARACVAILLISPDYLARPFVQEVELPKFLEAEAAGLLTVITVHIRACQWELTDVARFQAVNDPKRPLQTYPRDRDRVLADVGRRALEVYREHKARSVGAPSDSPAQAERCGRFSSQSPSPAHPERSGSSPSPVQLERSSPSPSPSQPERSGSSPFIPGGPILRDEDFFGRERLCRHILEVLEKGMPVQLLGERRMGKTSMLRYLERHLPADAPVAFIHGGGEHGRSPSALVRAVADSLGRRSFVGPILDRPGVPPSTRAAEALPYLAPAVFLVDEAETLPERWQPSDQGFLNALRSHTQEKGGSRRKLHWVSASWQDLHPQFYHSRLSSAFLNDGQALRIGQLELPGARALLARVIPPPDVDCLLEAGAGFPLLLQALGETWWFNGGRAARAVDSVRNDVREVLNRWWTARTPGEQEVLTLCLTPRVYDGLPDPERGHADELIRRGLLEEQSDLVLVPGKLWPGFVRGRGGG